SSWQYSLVILAIFMTGTWICGAEMVIPKLLDAPSNINTTMSNVIILRLAAGTFVALCMVAWGFFAASGLSRQFIVGLAISVALRETFIVGLTWYQSQARLKLPCLVLMLAAIIKLIVIYIGLRNQLPINYLWVAWVIESLLPCGFIFYFFRKATGFRFVKVNSEIFSYLKIGVAIWCCLIMQQVTMKFDRVYLEGKISGEMYSNYAAALQLVDNWYAICILFVQAIAPIFIFKFIDIINIKRKLPFCVFATLAVTCTGALFTTVLADMIIHILYGEKLVNAYSYLRTFVWLTPILAIDQLLSMVIIRMNQLNKLAIKWLIAFCLVVAVVPAIYHYMGISNIVIGLAVVYSFNIIYSTRCIGAVQ
ncbi:O45 family O-antigen flippase, partial [Escherichia coli]|nr:O45 family O-antigen flippase [Escherichia coli]